MKSSLRWRFTIPLLFFLAITFIGTSLYFSKTFLAIYQTHLKDKLITEANLVVDNLSQLQGFPNSINDLQSKTEHFASILKVRVTIIQSDGLVLSDSEADPFTMENHLSRPEVQQALSGEDGFQIRYSTTLKTNMLYVTVPVIVNDQVKVIVRLARSLFSIESELKTMNTTIIIAGIVVLLLLFFGIFLLSAYTFKPLTQLTISASKVLEGKYETVPIRSTRNEIDQLSIVFNSMVTQINTQIKDLQEEKGKFGNILEQMLDGVLIVEKSGIIRLINPAAERMFSIKAIDALDQQLIKGLQQHQVVELFKSTLESGKQQVTTIDLRLNHRFLQGIGIMMRESNSDSVLLLFQDLTKQRQLEAMRQDFVSNVSHELRTPLASLKALEETLQDKALADPPAARHFLNLMDVEIDKLTQMVVELLELSRIESGRLQLKMVKFDLENLLSAPVNRLKLQAERAGVNLQVEYSDGPKEISVDGGQIEQVLMNLIHNAIKFTQPGGTIIVSAKFVGDQAIFSVRDNGVGISEEDIPRIFERFYKTDRARNSKGTGLGLSIAKHVVEAHGGKIWVESVEGKGSVFYFSIPAEQNSI